MSRMRAWRRGMVAVYQVDWRVPAGAAQYDHINAWCIQHDDSSGSFWLGDRSSGRPRPLITNDNHFRSVGERYVALRGEWPAFGLGHATAARLLPGCACLTLT